MNKVSLTFNFSTDLSKESVEFHIKEAQQTLLSLNKLYDLSVSFDFEELDTGRIKVFELPVDEVLSNLSPDKKLFRFQGKEYLVKMNSQRYFMFKENLCCVCCGLKGTKMFLEYHPYDMTPHFNLYGVDNGELVLMTKDHILAKALGGEDRHSNYQTMCSVCNGLKGHTSLTLDSLKTLRKVFDEKKSKMSKKQIHYFLEECKDQLKKKEKKSRVRTNKNCMVLNCDIACFLDSKGSIYGRHIYEKINDTRIGCMKKGTVLDPILEYKGEIICSIGEKDSIRILRRNLSVAQ